MLWALDFYLSFAGSVFLNRGRGGLNSDFGNSIIRWVRLIRLRSILDKGLVRLRIEVGF